ncbi:ATP-binding protein [Motilibacter rhizosphaerae]|uniref:ATP-binding protein n=1 Tax=Motilibacter rhizosphaerae TaxID=598652 RepID=UPI00102AFACB|nr:BTAD domain-containing putative transcriptional regulator [Motilibacter rhizosphaerae]
MPDPSPAPAADAQLLDVPALEVPAVDVLGPLRVRRGTAQLEAGPPKQRALLAALALHCSRPVDTDALAELVWAGRPPRDAVASLHAYVARLRQLLEPGRASRARPELLLRSGAGYQLQLPDGAVDAHRFARTVLAVHAETTGLLGDGVPAPVHPAARTRAAELLEQVEEARAAWRGAAYVELGDGLTVASERVRLEELRLVALEDAAALRLALGQPAPVVTGLAAALQEHPLRERLWLLRVAALARSQRQADALAELREVRRLLRDELGIDPGPALVELEAAVLRQEQPPAVTPAPAPPARTGLIGRQRELRALDGLLAAGQGCAALVGEPGIGKSRLASAFAERATAAGWTVLLGRCAEDEGAPPLWPWTGVLRGLAGHVELEGLAEVAGIDAAVLPGLGSPAEGGGSDRFRTYDAVARLLRAAAARLPLLVVLEDLHWADASSLRLLRYLLDTTEPARLVVLVTRRARPQPTGALAEVGEALARASALRVELAGLTEEETAELVRRSTGREPAGGEAAALRDRADGNPFFLEELLRLGAGDPAVVPQGVGEVVRRRVDQLPEGTRQALGVAAVVGRSYAVPLVAAAGGRDEDDVLGALAPAAAVGLVVEEAAEQFRFSHALVRDAVYDALPATSRARTHAAVARALEEQDGHEGLEGERVVGPRSAEVAWHWLHAGPRHARRAWRAAVEAGRYATALHAYEEAARLLDDALAAQALDPASTPAERWELRMAQAEALRWAGDLRGLGAALHAALDAARLLPGPEPLTRAALVAAETSLWLPRPYGEVDPVTVAALEEALERLPPEDGPLRARVLLALAAEVHYAPGGRQRRESLAAEGLRLARRDGDEAALARACQLAAGATWWAGNALERIALLTEALVLAPAVGDEAWLTAALLQRASAAAEAGYVADHDRDVAAARRHAERLGSPYLLAVLGTLGTGWLAMRGRADDARELAGRTMRTVITADVPYRGEVLVSTTAALSFWSGGPVDPGPLVEAVPPGSPLQSAVLLALLRAGDLPAARAHLAEEPLPLEREDFIASVQAAAAAEAGWRLGLPDLAERGRRLLADLSGGTVSAGSGVQLGPVDAYLAMAAAAVGDDDSASRLSAAALRSCAAWGTTAVADWVEGLGLQRRRTLEWRGG